MSRGSVSIEVAVLAPAFVAMMVLGGVAGRTAVALEAAAHDAARPAGGTRGRPPPARLAGSGLLRGPQVTLRGSVDGRSTTFNRVFTSQVGQNATVTVEIACTVSYADMNLPALTMPDGQRITASFTSPLDRYRSRG